MASELEMQEAEDAIERLLREKAELRAASEKALEQAENQWKQWEARAEDLSRQLAERDAELARMREALRPLSRIADAEDFAGTKDGDSIMINVSLCRIARTALSGSGDGGWRDTASAPKDGTRILACGISHGPGIDIIEWGNGRYLGRKRGFEQTWISHPGHAVDPKGWMPLPAAPAPAGGDDA